MGAFQFWGAVETAYYTQVKMKTGDLPLPSPHGHEGKGVGKPTSPPSPLPIVAYHYPHLPRPEEGAGKIFREAASFPEDATGRSPRGNLVGNGKVTERG